MSQPETEVEYVDAEVLSSDGSAPNGQTTPSETTDLAPLSQRVEEALKPILQKSAREQDVGIAIRRVTQIVQEESYSGSLPHPKHFEQFEKALPGSAGRILAMAENEQAHRHNWETRAIRFEFIYSIFGLLSGLIVAVALIAAGIWTGITGHTGVAIAFVGASAVGMVGAFIKGRDIFEMIRPQKEKPVPSKRPSVPAKQKGKTRR